MVTSFTEVPIATITIMLICIGVSFFNSSLNRLLVSRFVGWEQYRDMQRETTEYRKQMTQATRSKDKKTLEKLKRKESQILNMQKKMAKPQLVLFAISFSYIFIWWFILTPLYGSTTVAYIPGIGPISVFLWYFICSFLFGALSSRLLGILPIE